MNEMTHRPRRHGKTTDTIRLLEVELIKVRQERAALRDALLALNVSELSPLEALTKLHELKRLALNLTTEDR